MDSRDKASPSRQLINKDIIFKVDHSNQIEKSGMFNLTPSQLQERTYLKMGTLVTDANENLFKDFMVQFEKFASVSQNFRVHGLQDYTEFPIEQFDVKLDPTRDIEYMLSQDNQALSRWADAEGTITWRRCKVLNYDKTKNQFLIQWEDSDVLKNVTRMNLLFARRAA